MPNDAWRTGALFSHEYGVPASSNGLLNEAVLEAEFHWRAEIVHNKHVKGRVVTEHITDLGGITTSAINQRGTGCLLGSRKERLDRLHNRTTPAEHARIESALSAKVPYTEMPKTIAAHCRTDRSIVFTMRRIVHEGFDGLLA